MVSFTAKNVTRALNGRSTGASYSERMPISWISFVYKIRSRSIKPLRACTRMPARSACGKGKPRSSRRSTRRWPTWKNPARLTHSGPNGSALKPNTMFRADVNLHRSPKLRTDLVAMRRPWQAYCSRPLPQSLSFACACRKSNASILVMQSTQDRPAKNASCCLGGTRYRRVLVQRYRCASKTCVRNRCSHRGAPKSRLNELLAYRCTF